MIADALGAKVSVDSYYEHTGISHQDRADGLTQSYLRKDGHPLDLIAMNANYSLLGDYDTVDPVITTDMIVDFMHKYPRLSDYYSFLNKSGVEIDLEEKFRKLTGLSPVKANIDLVLQGKKESGKVQKGEFTSKPSETTDTSLETEVDLPRSENFDDVPFHKGKDFVSIPKSSLDKLIDRLTSAFPKMKGNVVVDGEALRNRLSELSEKGYDVSMQVKESVRVLESELLNKHPELKTLSLSESGDVISINMIEVEKADRKKGIGSEIIQEIADYADATGKTLELIPELKDRESGTASKKRLVEFYKRFGFVENKGRNKDFSRRSGGMYRTPVEFMRNKTGDVYGFVDPENGRIYMDDARMNANTPIHEFGHIWTGVLEAQFPVAHKKLIDAVKRDKKAMDAVRNDPAYKHLKTDEQIADEALARFIGDKGEQKFLQEEGLTDKERSIRQRIFDEIQRIWEGIKKYFDKANKDIRKWTNEQWDNATMSDLTEAITGELLGGEDVIEKNVIFEQNKADNDQRTTIYSQLESVLGRSGTQETQVGRAKEATDDGGRTSLSVQALRQRLADHAKRQGKYIDDISSIVGEQLPSGHESEVYESKNGETVVVATRSHGILVKRLHPAEEDNKLRIVSDNKDYPPFDVNKEEITGIALVVGVIRLE